MSTGRLGNMQKRQNPRLSELPVVFALHSGTVARWRDRPLAVDSIESVSFTTGTEVEKRNSYRFSPLYGEPVARASVRSPPSIDRGTSLTPLPHRRCAFRAHSRGKRSVRRGPQWTVLAALDGACEIRLDRAMPRAPIHFKRLHCLEIRRGRTAKDCYRGNRSGPD